MIENARNSNQNNIDNSNKLIGFLVVGSLSGFVIALLYLEYLGYVISDLPLLNYGRFLSQADYDLIDIAIFIEYVAHFYILFFILKKRWLRFARGFFLGNIIAIFLWTFYYAETWNLLTSLDLF
ncbi:MAG: hypothetical protein AAB783_00125 [Patescibacteria group bacterium]